ncbi:PIG-L family deacetylase [Kitasatospora sp. NPDC059571]|uniref:PIG-L family deacetylase n=1 Tax=Kitasatospora sp. NPDC059571 TaxID=3346871 RepID=UPI0036A3BA51
MAGPISRRRALWLTGGALALPASGYGVWQAVHGGRAAGRVSADSAGGSQAPGVVDGPARANGIANHNLSQSFVHVIAHPDDNLYFMNPDLDHALASGAACVTVCLTDGESDGRNVLHSELGRVTRADRPAYTRARINGLTAALALLATGDEGSPWDVELVSYLEGRLVEQHTLRAAPQVQLILLALVEARSVSLPRKESLRGLWLGETPALETLPPVHSGLPPGAGYTREQLIATLHGVLDHFRPTVVRTLDPNPDHSPKAVPGVKDTVYLDHQDHTYSTYFAQAALTRHWAGGKARSTSVEHYLGYVNAVLPHNLDQAAVGRKVVALNSYGWADNRHCGDPAGCGDRKVGAGALRNGWAQSTRYRAPGSDTWLQPLADGRLTAFALLNGGAVRWTQSDGSWRGPERIPGGDLEGQLQVVRQADGRLRLIAVRTHLGYAAAQHRREVVTCVQDGDDSYGPWQSLGAPDGDDAVRSMEFGYPVAAVLPDGTVQIAARTWSGTVAVRTLDTPWTALALPPQAGSGVQDGLGIVVDGDGTTHVLAPGRTVVHWASTVPGGPLRPAAPTGLPTPAGPVTALLAPGGGLRLEFREPKSARVLTAERRSVDGGWRVTAESAPPGGFGRVSAGAGALAVRDDRGRIALRAAGRDWQHDGPLLAHSPALATDADGRAVAAALGSDGNLYIARQPVPGAPFGAWSQAG